MTVRLTVDRGFCLALVGITLPDDASLGLPRAMGFEPAGTFRDVGYKSGSWHDVAWMQRPLLDRVIPPREPRCVAAFTCIVVS